MRKVYQLHFQGVNRAHHNFSSTDEATHHQGRLIRFCKDKIASGQRGYQKYLGEANAMEIVSVEVPDTSRVYSVIEHTALGSGVVRSYFNPEEAQALRDRLQDTDSRHYSTMETFVNGQH